MKNKVIIAGLLFFVICCLMFCNKNEQSKDIQEKSDTTQTLNKTELVDRGKYLVTIMSCNDCHTPKIMTPEGMILDSSRLLSGYPSDMELAKVDTMYLKDWVLFKPDLTSAVGPWGVSYAANITSDETGIGSWTEEQFATAIRKGKYKGLENSRPLLPPMPWQSYAALNNEDLKAIFYYLKSVKPIKNIPPAPKALSQISQK